MEKYITQKSQKIVSALYLITDHIKDSDVIKWEIREEGITLVSNSLISSSDYPIEKDHAIKNVSVSLEKIIALLNITLISSLISKMNVNIVISELESLINFIEKDSKENHLPGYILSDSFFSTDSADKMTERDDKGHEGSSRTLSTFSTQNGVKKEDKKEGRKDSIIAILKKDSNLTIKDFTKVIKDCSEKTIQRELISLVKSGIVKRVGERRWSTYSLA